MRKNNSFIKGAAVLGIAGVIVKILGAIYRIPLSNIIKSEGMGYYQTAYPFYTLLLTISTAGFPLAIAKLVSEKRSIGDHKNAYKIFRVSLVALGLVGLVTSAYLFLRAGKIVEGIGNTKAYYSLVALTPALFFVPIMSAFRGYFQGRQDMVPTAISQIGEQFIRVVFGLGLTYLLLSKGVPQAAGGASFGGSLGAIGGTLAIAYIFLKNKDSINKELEGSLDFGTYESRDILKDLLKIAVPITIGASIVPIMDYIDLKLVLTRLQSINFTEAEANELYGNLKGMAQTLINLPQVFSVAIAMSLVPAISDLKARGENKDLEDTISSGIRMTLLIGLPAAVGLFVLAHPIINLLYYKNTAETIMITGNILKILSVSVIFLTLVQSLSGILQGIGRPSIPAINLFIGALVKAGLTYYLTGLAGVNIYGAAISTVVAYGIASILDLYWVKKYVSSTRDFIGVFLKPALSALGMGLVVSLTFSFLGPIVGSNLATLISIAIGGLVYLILLLVTKSISKEDLDLIMKRRT